MQSPQDLESLSHGLDAWAHPLEWEGLPAGEHGDVAGRHELSKVIDELARHCPGGACHNQGPPTRQVSERCDGDRTGDLDDREPCAGIAEGTGQAGFIAEQSGQRFEWGVAVLGGSRARCTGKRRRHRLTLYRCIAASTPSDTIISTASAASAIVTSRSSRSRLGTFDST